MQRLDLEHGLWMYNDPSFPLGADAVQLAHFASAWVRPGMRVCDAGCGAGAVMLLMAGACPEAAYTGVEIREDAALLAEKALREQGIAACEPETSSREQGIAACEHGSAARGQGIAACEQGIAAREQGSTAREPETADVGQTLRISVVHADLRQAHTLPGFEPGSFDMVVSNPPYFPVGGGKLPRDPGARVARTEECLTLDELCKQSARLLRSRGSFCAVIPPGRLPELMAHCAAHGLQPRTLAPVFPGAGEKPACMTLLRAVRDARPGGFEILPGYVLA